MPEVSGAREELEDAARKLCGYLLELAGQLEPDQQPTVTMLPEPAILDWQEPLRHAHQARLVLTAVEGGSGRYAVWLATRLLTSAGWEVTTGSTPTETCAVARRDGYRLAIRTWHGADGTGESPDVGISGTTPHILLYEPVPFTPPEPMVTRETLKPGRVLCYECDGLGLCPNCLGRAYTVDEDQRRGRCGFCRALRTCPVCEGYGWKSIEGLNRWELGYYPELDRAGPDRS